MKMARYYTKDAIMDKRIIKEITPIHLHKQYKYQ